MYTVTLLAWWLTINHCCPFFLFLQVVLVSPLQLGPFLEADIGDALGGGREGGVERYRYYQIV